MFIARNSIHMRPATMLAAGLMLVATMMHTVAAEAEAASVPPASFADLAERLLPSGITTPVIISPVNNTYSELCS